MQLAEINPAPLDVDVVLSPEWLTGALQTAFPGARVTETRVVDVIETTARKVRLAVTYDRTTGHDGPVALCVKGYFNPEYARFAVTGQHEVRFYERLAPLVPIRRPIAYYTGIDQQTKHGLVIMNDVVADGAVFFDQLSWYEIETAKRSLDELAGLHAAFWNHPLGDEDWLAPKIRTFPGYIPSDIMNELLAGPRGEGLPPEMRDADRLKAGLFALADRYASRPRTLIHADAHLGNLFRSPDGRIGFVDWQNYEFGHWSMDVAYHVTTALDPKVRAEHELELLQHYLTSLAAAGGPTMTVEESMEDYRAALAYGFFLWAMTRRVAPRITEELTQRLGRAVLAHGSLDVLGV
jgi:hypothetical protein